MSFNLSSKVLFIIFLAQEKGKHNKKSCLQSSVAFRDMDVRKHICISRRRKMNVNNM